MAWAQQSLRDVMGLASGVYRFSKSLRHAPEEVRDRAILVEAISSATHRIAEFLERASPSLDIELVQLHTKVLQTIAQKIQDVNKKLKGFQELIQSAQEADVSKSISQGKDILDSARYATKKNAIDEAISELQIWVGTADLIHRTVLTESNESSIGRHINKHLQTAKFPDEGTINLRAVLQNTRLGEPKKISAGRLKEGLTSKLPYCVANVLTGGDKTYVVDSLPCATATNSAQSTVMNDALHLARKLQYYEEPLYGLFHCYGVVPNDSSRDMGSRQGMGAIKLVFKIPKKFSNLQSLRSAMLDSRRPSSLSDVVKMGLELAQSVCHVHILDFVHKSIRPEAIVLCQATSTNAPSPFLVGFDRFRKDGGHTELIGTSDWKLNLYAHPKRYGVNPVDAYVMQHDIYSLGVCLLEIGLWESFIKYEVDEEKSAKLSELLTFPHQKAGYNYSAGFKEQFLALARESLPARMGTRYARVVETCLTCLDDGNEDFGDEWEFQDETGIRVGVRYIEKVIMQLAIIQV